MHLIVEFSIHYFSTQLAIHWHGFHDVHSGISHIEWKAGTTPGGDDVLQSTHVHKANHASTILDTSLTPGQKVFSTVTVWNLAGVYNFFLYLMTA